MTRNRLEAFSDGVIAIIITIMVLELHPPDGASWHDLLAPDHHLPAKFLAYVLSFVYLGIYWNNHHHLMHVVERVDGRIMWANMHLLFWLSLVPFTTAWMGEFHADAVPAAVYGASLLLPAVAYTILVRSIVAEQLEHSGGRTSRAREAFGADIKGYVSLLLYAIGIGAAFASVWIAYACFFGVACIWLIPDRRVTRKLGA